MSHAHVSRGLESKRGFPVLLLVALAASATSCIGGDSDDDSSDLFDPSALQGNWASECYQVSPASGYSEHSMKEVLSFAGSTFTITDILYTDSSCLSAYITLQTVMTFVTGDAPPTNSAARTIDLTLSGLQITPSSAQGETDLNTDSMCGLSDWANGTPKELAGILCDGARMPSAGSKSYGIVQVGDLDMFGIGSSGSNKLYLGSSFSSSSASRPTAISTEPYTKQ